MVGESNGAEAFVDTVAEEKAAIKRADPGLIEGEEAAVKMNDWLVHDAERSAGINRGDE